MPVVYERPVMRRFTAPRASAAYCLFLALALTALVLPFFLAYSASGPSFWSKSKVYWEQPIVKYEYKFVLVLEGTQPSQAPNASGGGALPLTIFYSPVSNLNAALGGDNVRVPVVRSKEVDLEGDGRVDRLELSLAVPLAPGEAVTSASLLVFLDVTLSAWALAKVPGAALLAHASPLPGQALYVDADLGLRQTWPLPSRGGWHVPYGPVLDDRALLPWRQGNGSHQNFLPNLVKAYRSRNYTTELGGGGAAVWTASGGRAWGSTFNLTATLRFPAVAVRYTPGVGEVLLDGWVKYLSLAVVVVWLLDKGFARFVFHHHLVDATEAAEDGTGSCGQGGGPAARSMAGSRYFQKAKVS